MRFKVQISEPAAEQIADAYDWLAERTVHASEWHYGLLKTIDSLEENPLRCPLVPEDEDPVREARQILYGSKRHAYRIIFDVGGSTVTILEVRHGARKRPQ